MTRAATDTQMVLGLLVFALLSFGAAILAFARSTELVGSLPDPEWFFRIGTAVGGVAASACGALATYGIWVAFRTREG